MLTIEDCMLCGHGKWFGANGCFGNKQVSLVCCVLCSIYKVRIVPNVTALGSSDSDWA